MDPVLGQFWSETGSKAWDIRRNSVIVRERPFGLLWQLYLSRGTIKVPLFINAFLLGGWICGIISWCKSLPACWSLWFWLQYFQVCQSITRVFGQSGHFRYFWGLSIFPPQKYSRLKKIPFLPKTSQQFFFPLATLFLPVSSCPEKFIEKFIKKFRDKFTEKYIEKLVEIFKEKFKEKFREKFKEKYIEKFEEKYIEKFEEKYIEKFRDGRQVFSYRREIVGGIFYLAGRWTVPVFFNFFNKLITYFCTSPI